MDQIVKIDLQTLINVLITKDMIRLFISALVVIGMFQTALAYPGPSDDVIVPQGAERALSSDDFRPHQPDGNAYNEIWTYTFLLDGGMRATFSMSYANLGSLMAPVSGAEFSVSGFNGKTYRAPKEYDAEDLIYTPANSRLQVQPSIYAEGVLPRRHSVYFKARKHGVQFDVALTLSDITPGLTWGDGVFQLGDERLGMFIHIPYARVSGSISIDGVEKRVSGTAYMDHTYQTEFAPKLVSSTFRYVQHSGAMEVGYLIKPHARYDNRVIGLGAIKEGNRFRLRKPQGADVISTRKALGAEVPNQLAVRYTSGDPTILNRNSDQQAFSVLEELGSLQRAVVRRYIGGEVVVFRGRGITNNSNRVDYDYLIVK